jgi:hypothetical protein
MSASTTRLSLTKPGGGSTGLITPADIVDIDVLNANFDKIDASMGYTIATSGARPSTPFNGQPIFETDTKNEMYWSVASGRWIPIGVPNAASQALRDALYPSPVGGERVFRTDLNYHQHYSAAAAGWRGGDLGSGLVLVKPTIAGGAGATVAADGLVTLTAVGNSGFPIFTFPVDDFDQFRLICTFWGTTAPQTLFAQFAVGGAVDILANYYLAGYAVQTGPSSAIYQNTAVTQLSFGNHGASSGGAMRFTADFMDMASTTRQSGVNFHSGSNNGTGVYYVNASGFYNANKRHDGLAFIPPSATTLSGTFRIYGYNNG